MLSAVYAALTITTSVSEQTPFAVRIFLLSLVHLLRLIRAGYAAYANQPMPREISPNGDNLHDVEPGEGSPLILIHGGANELGNKMRLGILCCAMASLPVCTAQGQTQPLVDYHQHLFSPAAATLVSATPLPPIELPPDLDLLVQARGREAQSRSALADLYTEDVWLVESGRPNWIRGRDSVIAWWMQSAPTPFHLTPVGWAVADSAGYVTAYLTEGRGESTRHVAHVLLSLRKGPDARWRIAAEALTRPGPPSISAISASDLVALLDAAGIRRALVLSMGYTWGNPNRTVENEYAKVKAENDWTGQQVARFPDRLRAFCSFNPLRDYALDELARCAKDPQLRFGLKLHLANSVLDYHNAQHVEQLRRVFRVANDQRMPIIVHMRSSISRGLPYGRDEARVFLNEILPAAPDIPVQIAHLAGAGGYDDPTTDQALGVFVEAIANHDPRTKHLYFDVSGVVSLDISPEKAKLVATRIRQLRLDRILYGSDAATAGNLAPRQAWAAFRQLPLSDAEFRAIASNVAPYMR